jgi:hypothetical protein
MNKNSKAYKKARRQKALAYGESVRKANKLLEAKARAENEERAAMFPTPPALKILRIRRTVALRILELIDAQAVPPSWATKEDVKFVIENRKMIEETDNKHYLFHAKVQASGY